MKKEIKELFIISDFIKKQYRKELDIKKGSATRNWLEKNKPNHPLLKTLNQ